MSDERERCDWSELWKDQCEHCDPAERPTKPKTEHELWIEKLRVEVERALLDASTTTVYPAPKIAPTRQSTSSTPKWNADNIAAQIGGHLTAIQDMFDALHEEAENRYRDREFPGGDAMVMLGPGPDIEAFNYRQISAMVGRIDEADVMIAGKRDIEPPLSFLASWEDILREERDQPVFLRATIRRAIKYIRDSIDWMLSTDENADIRFIAVDDLAEQLGHVRRRMEDILKDGSRAEFTRVNCIAPECTHPRLMKLWAAQVRWDRYRCPDCRTEYTTAQYELAKSQNLHDRGLERFIAPIDAAEGAKVPIKTVRSWMRRRKAERRWIVPTDGNPFAEVWWPDVRDLGIERRARLDRQAIRRAALKAEKQAEAERKAREAEDDTPEREPLAS